MGNVVRREVGFEVDGPTPIKWNEIIDIKLKEPEPIPINESNLLEESIDQKPKPRPMKSKKPDEDDILASKKVYYNDLYI